MYSAQLPILFYLLFSTVVYAVPWPTALDLQCKATPYVVIDTYHVEPYVPGKHGEPDGLRIYDHMDDSSCYQKIWSSPSTDLQLRDTNTGLSTFVYRRGFFSWALSILKFAPIAFAGSGLGILGGIAGIVSCTLTVPGGEIAGLATCIVGAALPLIGSAMVAVDQAVKANRALNAANQLVQLSSMDWLNAHYTIEPFKRREIEGPESEKHDTTEHKHSGLYHAHDHSEVTWVHMARANETHPIHIYHYGKYHTANATVKMWSSLHNTTHSNQTNTTLRFNFHVPLYNNLTFETFPESALEKLRKLVANERAPGSMGYPGPAGTKKGRSFTETLGQEEYTDTTTLNGILPNAPSGMYYGYDVYGDLAHEKEYDSDLGVKYDASNGFLDGMLELESDMYTKNAWDECVCMQSNGQWISTGSMQMTWNNGNYNGYSPCWNPNCDGA